MTPDPAANGDGLHILLVEDDPAISNMYRVKLTCDGHRVTVAGDGASGLRAALSIEPDLVLLDIRLPGLDGLELLERLRGDERGRHLLVVILSNYNGDEILERARRLGARQCLLKSETTPGLLCERVRGLFRASAVG